MYKYVRLCLVLVVSCVLLSGCSQLNPFASPVESTEVRNEDVNADEKTDNYMENVEEQLDQNAKTTEENANNYSEKIDDATESIYYNALDEFTTTKDDNDGDSSFFTSILLEFYGTYSKLRLASVWIVISSLVFGILGCAFTRHNKGAKRFFLTAFIFAVPLLMIVIVFGIGILNGLFLYK